MGGFDDFINTAIPIIVLILGLYFLYRPLKEPIDKLVNLIRSGVLGLKGRISKEPVEETAEGEIIGEIQFE